MDGCEKIPNYLVFSKLVLDDVKVNILLISWHFLELLFVATPPTHSFTPLFFCFWYIKGFQVVHMWDKFHLHLTCSSQVLEFDMFSYQQKVKF